MKVNVFAMNDNELIQFIQEEVQTFRSEVLAGNYHLKSDPKVKLSELQQYSKLLQKPVFLGVANAAELKTEIDSYLGNFCNEPMKRNVQPLTMQEYYKQTKQYSQFAK
ncbi:hypothetical protein [Pelosinus propionicus]|uniref:Uncharacterized protein n=1 Tax=Pelosinus propionicus DSM 13327 TaxID=1123291 RepID=A0A1I4QG55_9FIRM|nr:hypothetical protein [Pelosinus propionicus]SFM38593.1 hypothetical protein SAMN04490355_10977 [Pelosinus propionicus DSM 13327]